MASPSGPARPLPRSPPPGRCEYQHLAEVTDPLTRIDIEAAFLLAVPLVDLDVTHSGACLLAVDTGGRGPGQPTDRLAGVHVEVEEGRSRPAARASSTTPETWVLGSTSAWVDAILEGKADRLRIGGSRVNLAEDLVRRLHTSLLGR